MAKRAFLLAVVLSAWVGVVASAPAQDWPRFRGPGGLGLGDAPNVPATWSEQDYNWKVAVPGVGHSSPVVVGKRIYLTTGDTQTARRTVLCLDTADGKTLWKREWDSSPFRQHSDNSFASATPAADEHGVVALFGSPSRMLLVALDTEGKDMWSLDLGAYVGMHGSGSSPVIVGDVVVLANEQEDPGALPTVYRGEAAKQPAGVSFLIGLDRKSGKERWRIARKSDQAPYTTPCEFRAPGGPLTLVFSSTAHGLTAVDPAAGKIVWEVGKLFKDRCCASPSAGAGLVIAGDGLGSRGTHQMAVRPTADGATVAYEIKKPTPQVPSPLIVGDLLFLWNDDGWVACYKTATGEQIWREKVGGAFYGSPVCTGKRIYCISRKGEVAVIAAADKYELLGKVSLGEPSYTTPAIAGGRMYIRGRGHLFSLGK